MFIKMKKILYLSLGLALFVYGCKEDQPPVPEETGGFKAVDMGLSVLWANMDLGAEEVGEYGSYYAWAEVEANRENYDQNYYRWGNYSTLSKYLPLSYNGRKDDKAFLDEDDDAAHVELGGEWRIPTLDEASELFETQGNENYRWETVEVNGHSCRKITYLVNGNSILLPFSGYKFRGQAQTVGTRHYSWTSNCVAQSSSMHMAYIIDAILTFKAGDETEGISSKERWYGCTIRPVKAPRRIPVCSMSLTIHDKAVAEDTKFTPTVTIWPENADNKTLKWKSDNPEVASVNENGEIAAHKSGYTSIRCSHGALKDELKIEVAPFGYGIYVKNEREWENTYLKARLSGQSSYFTGESGQEPKDETSDGYLYFELDDTMMDQEFYYQFIDRLGNSSAEVRKPNYSKRVIYTTLN